MSEATLADNVGREDFLSDTNLAMDNNNIDTTNVTINNIIDENNKNNTIDTTDNIDNIESNLDYTTINNNLPYDFRPRTKKFDVKSGQFKALITRIEKQVNELGDSGMSAMKAELKQLLDKHVFDPVYKQKIPFTNGKQNILSNQSLIKVKRDNIVKARSVGGGHRQDKSVYDILKELSSSTIKSESIMLIFTLALMNNDFILSADIVGAYLNAFMERDVYMKFNKFESKLLCELNNDLVKFINEDDHCLYVKLVKALYGCVESAKLFYNLLKKVLLEYGFVLHPLDDCVFRYQNSEKNYINVGIHVDDILITSNNNNLITNFKNYLLKNFYDVKFNEKSTHSYLGLNINIQNKYYEFDMISNLEKIIKDYGNIKISLIPATNEFFKDSNTNILQNINDKNKFHSYVAKLLYIARFVRPDILGYVSYLTSRVQNPTFDDKLKLEKLLGYLLFTINMKFKLSNNICNEDKSITINTYIDSSHGLHSDMKGRTGIIIKLGNATIFAFCKISKTKN
jgi:hypothetical protein